MRIKINKKQYGVPFGKLPVGSFFTYIDSKDVFIKLSNKSNPYSKNVIRIDNTDYINDENIDDDTYIIKTSLTSFTDAVRIIPLALLNAEFLELETYLKED